MQSSFWRLLISTLVMSFVLAASAPPAQGRFWRRQAAPQMHPAAAQVDVRRLATAVHERTNAERARARLRPLEQSAVLATAAEGHSRDMAERNYFSHTTKSLLRGQSFSDRLRSAGVSGRRLAENIALLPVRLVRLENAPGEVLGVEPDYDGMARDALRMWMGSAGHRRNILDAHLDSLGVGCWVGQRSGVPYVYMTQNFGDLR